MRGTSQFEQSSGQTVSNRTLHPGQAGSQFVRVIPPNQHGQQSKALEIAQTRGSASGQMSQNGLIMRQAVYNTNDQYQQNINPSARKFQQIKNSNQAVTFQQLDNQHTAAIGLQGISQQQQQPQQQKPVVVTLGSQLPASVHSHAGYTQSTGTVVNTQPNNGMPANSQVVYQNARPGLAQIKAAYDQSSHQPQQMVQIVQSSGTNTAKNLRCSDVSFCTGG